MAQLLSFGRSDGTVYVIRRNPVRVNPTYHQDCYLQKGAHPRQIQALWETEGKPAEGRSCLGRKKVGRAIGGRLGDARRLNSMSQEEVSREIRKTRQAISRWERGLALPSLLEFRELAVLYGESADWLMFGIRTTPVGSRTLQEIFREREEGDTERPFGL